MQTNSDRYWWKLNKNTAIVLCCTLPVALVFPVVALVAPIIALYIACDKFLVLFCSVERQDDSMRLMMTLPFSREQIFATYRKGLAFLSGGYFLLVALARLLLWLTNFPIAIFWGDMRSLFAVVCYLALLLTGLIVPDIFLICLIQNYTSLSKSIYCCVTFLAALPALFVLLHLKSLVQFATGCVRMKMGVSYDFGVILKMGLPERTAEFVALALYCVLIAALSITLCAAASQARKSIIRGWKNAQ